MQYVTLTVFITFCIPYTILLFKTPCSWSTNSVKLVLRTPSPRISLAKKSNSNELNIRTRWFKFWLFVGRRGFTTRLFHVLAWYTIHTFNHLNCFMSWAGILSTLSITCLNCFMSWPGILSTLSISWSVPCHGLVYYSHFQLFELIHVLAWYNTHTFNYLNCFMSWPGLLSTLSISWTVSCHGLVYYPHFQFLELFHVWMAWYTIHTFNFLKCCMS